MEHVNIPLGEVHTPHNWQWADEAARAAEVVTDVALIDRVGLQLSDGTLWRLAAVLPAAAWEPVAQVVPWAGVTGKPEIFAPSAHEHTVADVAGLQAALDGKQPTGAYIVEGDARLADARPASDVYAWAKAASKPDYTPAEVGATPAEHAGATGTAHGTASTSVAGFMSAADKTKLDGVAANANNYAHPTGDGNLHVPATGTTNAGKVLTAGATAGSLSWAAPLALGSSAGTAAGTAAAGAATTAARSDHVHPVQTSVSGNAGTATKLATACTINGVSFDGSANITINAVDSTARIASSEKGAANGVATLGADGKVPAAQLPSYVDDVLEYANLAGFPATGSTSTIYVAQDTNKIYRWSGSAYIEISVGGGTADAAIKLATARTIGMTGDVTWTSAAFDGLGNVTGAATLAASGATAGTYKSVTVDAKGRVTAGTNPTTLAGYGITDAAASSHNHTASSITQDAENRFVTDAEKTAWNAKVATGDTRLSDAREWTAATVGQAEAEAGTATTRRAWTAERVKQAIAAWWSGIVGTVVQQSDIGTAPNEIPLNQHLGGMAFQNPESVVIRPAASAAPQQVGAMVFQLTNDTTLLVKVKGSDGTVRSTTLTLA